MIGDFLQALGGDTGDAFVAGLGEGGQHVEVPGVVEELLGDGHRVVAVGLFHQQQIAEGALVTAERQLIGIATIGQQLDGVLVPVARLANQVKADVHQRQLFFQGRRVAAPFAQTLALDQGTVGKAQQVFDLVVMRVHSPDLTCGRLRAAARRSWRGDRPCPATDRTAGPFRPGRKR
ncbi:hypothetical protein D3C78_1419440 [compost metagenome]